MLQFFPIFLTRVSKFFQRVIFILQKTIQKTFKREKENEELIEIIEMESNDDSEFQDRRDKQFANCKSLLEFNVARIRDNLRVKKAWEYEWKDTVIAINNDTHSTLEFALITTGTPIK